MSVYYMFVDREKDNALKEFQTMLESERDMLITRIKQFAATHPQVVEEAENTEFDVQNCQAFAWKQPYLEEHVIGSATAANFKWNLSNGFGCFEKVELFLREHPGYIIQNDYGDQISIADFKDICTPRK